MYKCHKLQESCRPIENMQAIGEHFQLIDKLTCLFFDTSLKVGRRGSLKIFLQALSLPSFALVLPCWFSHLPFFSARPQLSRAWNTLPDLKKSALTIRPLCPPMKTTIENAEDSPAGFWMVQLSSRHYLRTFLTLSVSSKSQKAS